MSTRGMVGIVDLAFRGQLVVLMHGQMGRVLLEKGPRHRMFLCLVLDGACQPNDDDVRSILKELENTGMDAHHA
ncbi:MAG: hypothetical protein AAF530_08135 [Pseudomonadota bacterium]